MYSNKLCEYNKYYRNFRKLIVCLFIRREETRIKIYQSAKNKFPKRKKQQSRNWSVHSFLFLRKSTSNINYNIEVNRIHISDKYNNVYLQIPQHTDNQACCQ